MLAGCSGDDIRNHSEEVIEVFSVGITPSDLNSQELIKHPEVLEALNKLRDSGNKGKQGDEIYYSPLNIFIQVGLVRYIEKEGFQSYTFPVRKNYEDRKIMNLVLYRKGEDQFSATFVLYDFTPDELDLLNQKELESNPVYYIPVNLEDIFNQPTFLNHRLILPLQPILMILLMLTKVETVIYHIPILL